MFYQFSPPEGMRLRGQIFCDGSRTYLTFLGHVQVVQKAHQFLASWRCKHSSGSLLESTLNGFLHLATVLQLSSLSISDAHFGIHR